jgi:hypothetical protein
VPLHEKSPQVRAFCKSGASLVYIYFFLHSGFSAFSFAMQSILAAWLPAKAGADTNNSAETNADITNFMIDLWKKTKGEDVQNTLTRIL